MLMVEVEAATVQADLPAAAPRAAQVAVIPRATPAAVILQAVRAAVILQPLQKVAVPHPTLLMSPPARPITRAEPSTLSGSTARAITRKIRAQITRIRDENVTACYSALSGTETSQIHSGLIRKVDPTRLGAPVKERLHLIHNCLVPRLPNIWDIRRGKHPPQKPFAIQALSMRKIE